jgi:hypothetical protein
MGSLTPQRNTPIQIPCLSESVMPAYFNGEKSGTITEIFYALYE